MLACGVLGFFMRRFGLSPAALVIALVLGPMAEESLRQTMIISGGSFGDLPRPRHLAVLLILMVLLLVLPLVTVLLKRAAARAVARYGAMRRRSARRRGDLPTRARPTASDSRRPDDTPDRRGPGQRARSRGSP